MLRLKQTLRDFDLRRNMPYYDALYGVAIGFSATLGTVIQLRNNKVGRIHTFLPTIISI